MEVKVSRDYPVSLDRVLASFLDSDYLLRKYQTIGAKNIVISEEAAGEQRRTVVIQRDVDADVPSFAKKFFKPTNTVHERDEWDLSDPKKKQCQYVADVTKTPVKVTGTITLTALDEGRCRHDIACQIEVKIPLIGKKVAALVAEQTRESLGKELDFNLSELPKMA